MSRLYGLARTASEYIRNRFQQKYRDLDDSVEGVRRFGARRSDGGVLRRVRDLLFGRRDQGPQPPGSEPPRRGAPPRVPGRRQPPATPGHRQRGGIRRGDEVEPPAGRGAPTPPPPPRPPVGQGGAEEQYDEIELLGRDASYDEDDFYAVMENMRRTPGSSNVYGYFFERESRRFGILYVTFLQSYRGEQRSGAGPTYAYYDVPVRKANQFAQMAASSAGGAVWDYLRVRGTVWGHQHQYRLIHVSGEYVPRKATRKGFKTRNVPALGTGRRSFRRSTLPPTTFPSGGGPDRGFPNRGEPDRGRP